MTTQQNLASTAAPADLTRDELEALTAGAAWYAKYHQQSVPLPEDDPSAAAVARREHFSDLYSALDKLGLRLRRPDALRSLRSG
jgi:hypothetical protein